jgi:hypothetical protein
MKQELETSLLEESKYKEWNDFAARSPAGSVYADTEYLSTLCRATGGTFRVLGVRRGEQLCGGLAIYEKKTRAGVVLSNRLLLYYNGFVLPPHASSYPSERTSRDLAVLGSLETWLSRAGYAHAVVHSRAPIADLRAFLSRGWSARPSYSYVVGISDLEGAWGRVEQNLRRLVKRCEKEGAVLVEDGDFDGFYRLHRQTHERKGAPIYLPEKRFRKYVEELRATGMAKLFHARSARGESMAAQLVLLSAHPVCHTVCAGADKKFLSIGSTPFLRWKVFEWLSGAGYKGNDLTDASLNDVTHFKSQLGGELMMNLVLTKPDRLAYRALTGIGSARSKALSAAKRLVRGS